MSLKKWIANRCSRSLFIIAKPVKNLVDALFSIGCVLNTKTAITVDKKDFVFRVFLSRWHTTKAQKDNRFESLTYSKPSNKLEPAPIAIWHKSRTRGMSLVEVLVALVFISMAVAMFAYFVDAMRINQDSKKETAAALFAKDYMESLRAKWRSLDDYQNLALAAPGILPVGYELEIKIKNEQGGVIYAYPGGAASQDDSLLRTVSVQFNDEQEKKLEMQSIVARPTPVYQPAENQDDDHHSEDD
jgi:type II secretory pathway pseudopilin PulG